MKTRLLPFLLLLVPFFLGAQSDEGRSNLTEDLVFTDTIILLRNDLQKVIKLSENAGRVSVDTLGGSEYVNAFGDVKYLCVDSVLCRSVKVGGKWQEPSPLQGLEDLKATNPFMLQDGQTIYFSCVTSDSLDICVTRYSQENRVYLKPEILGFPYNSTSDDFLYCIDEQTGKGIFATSRDFETNDTVSVYYFLKK